MTWAALLPSLIYPVVIACLHCGDERQQISFCSNLKVQTCTSCCYWTTVYFFKQYIKIFRSSHMSNILLPLLCTVYPIIISCHWQGYPESLEVAIWN